MPRGKIKYYKERKEGKRKTIGKRRMHMHTDTHKQRTWVKALSATAQGMPLEIKH